MSNTFEYNFSYTDAPFIQYNNTVGFFINITARTGDSVGTPTFQPSGTGTDTLVVPITQSSELTPQTLSVCLYDNNSGYLIGQGSTGVTINVVDASTGDILVSETVQYGQGGISPKAGTEVHQINYIAAPYQMAPGNIGGNPASAFIISSMLTYPDDVATQPTFVKGSAQTPDLFTANITSNNSSGQLTLSVFVNGPFDIDSNSPGVKCETVVTTDGKTKPPITSPVGIKHYGSSTWHPIHH